MTDALYHAVVKTHADASPVRMNFRASNVAMSMRKMIEMCGVTDTTALYEFEILEVLGGNNYKRVAMKLPTASKPRVTPVAAITHNKANEDPLPVEEAEYVSYKLEVA